MVAWSPEEKCLLESTRSVLSTREIEKLLKILGYIRSTEAIQKQSKKLGISFKDFGDPTFSGDFTERERKAIVSVIGEREAQLAALAPLSPTLPFIKGASTSEKLKALDSILDELNQIRINTPRAGSLSSVRSSNPDKESLVLLLSDWHVGEIVKDNETGEVVYDIGVAEERIERTPALLVSAVGAERLSEIDECVVLLAGDIVTGEGIFPHQEMSLEDNALSQTLSATKMLWWLLQQMRATFPLTRIITCRGNHGRTAHSPEANWDNVIYQQLELLTDLDGGKNITIKNRYGEFNTVDIKGWRGMIRHSAPVQVETASGIAKYAGWCGIHDWDWFGFGHYHHWGVNTWLSKPIFRNGSLPGADEYSEGLGKADRPVQICWGMTESNPCTFVSPLYY